MLDIEDKNIEIINGERGNDGAVRLNGILDYKPLACPKCGITNPSTSHHIINYGWRETIVRFAKKQGSTVILRLKRRNFHCNECHGFFLAQTPLVPKNCSISNTTHKECIEKLTDPVSLKHIANELSTSDCFVGRMLMNAERDFKTNWHYLPKVLLMDEIKSTNTATDAMSFEFMDAENHQLIDVLPYRRMNSLETYFNQFDLTARKNVKVIVTDMNYTYPKLAQTVFPNAIVVIDRFTLLLI